MKKRLLVFAVIMAAAFSAKAQFSIGGWAGASLNKETKTFTIAPDVVYCFPETSFSLGCAIEYGGEWSDGKYVTNTLFVSPSVSYDIYSFNERFTLFVDLISDIDALQRNYFDIGLMPGISLMVTEHWSAEFNFGFLGYQREAVLEQPVKQDFVFDFETGVSAFRLYYNF